MCIRDSVSHLKWGPPFHCHLASLGWLCTCPAPCAPTSPSEAGAQGTEMVSVSKDTRQRVSAEPLATREISSDSLCSKECRIKQQLKDTITSKKEITGKGKILLFCFSNKRLSFHFALVLTTYANVGDCASSWGVGVPGVPDPGFLKMLPLHSPAHWDGGWRDGFYSFWPASLFDSLFDFILRALVCSSGLIGILYGKAIVLGK